jgi:hypothetical protein
MTGAPSNMIPVKSTSYKAVIPFYSYAALSFLAAATLVLFSADAFTRHYFHPHTLAVTHLMALGWGTMIILGASHQLVPVLIEGKLYSNILAYASFILAALGIPLLVYGLYTFNMGPAAQCGAGMINGAILCYLINLIASFAGSRNENVHAVFVFTAVLWLFLTTLVGLLLVCNFSTNILPADSLYYLSMHAHMGIVGWFLLLIIGVGSRLIPMFLISKYTNAKLLWRVYLLINSGLVAFVFLFLYYRRPAIYFIPVAAVLAALLLFGYYCYQSYKTRIRKQVDDQVKISILSASMTVLPVFILIIMIIGSSLAIENSRLVLAYGFAVFFGWITAIIMGMTFKTLPFIVWNKVYHQIAGLGKTPNPKALFSEKIFAGMALIYLAGFLLFTVGVLCSCVYVIKTAAVLLFLSALLYNLNVVKIIIHKPQTT